MGRLDKGEKLVGRPIEGGLEIETREMGQTPRGVRRDG
jgi:hypothetical protein